MNVRMRNVAIAVVVWCTGALRADDAATDVRFPAGHDDAGLPMVDAPMPVYHSASAHPLNRLHQLLFLAEITPEEINGTLPRELAAGTDASKPWYFRKRAGTDSDRRLFGGDVRVSPVIHWRDDRTAALRTAVNELLSSANQEPTLGLSPLNALMLQWDVLSVWWRLEQKPESSPEVLNLLAKLIVQLARPAVEWESLPTGWDEARTQFANEESGSLKTPYFSKDDILEGKQGWVELSRRSTKLFVAPQSLRSSRVFLKLPPTVGLDEWLTRQTAGTKSVDQRPPTRIETAMFLVLIGITSDLRALATPVIDEIRFRTVFAANDDIDLEQTTSHDGSSIWLYFIDRQQTFAAQSPRYRFLSPTFQSLFLEYGSAKHATYAAQCVLCHRLTNSGNQAVGGVRSLSPVAKASILQDPKSRSRLAEHQMSVVITRLEQRLRVGEAQLEPATFDYRQLVDLPSP